MASHGRGLARSRKGDNVGALLDYSEAIRLDATLSAAWNNRGVLRFQTNDFDGAVSDFSAALALDDRDEAAYTNRGAAYERQGNWPQAIADYQTALEVAAADWPLRGQVERRLAHAIEAGKTRPEAK